MDDLDTLRATAPDDPVVESAAVELGANGGGDRLAEATEFIAFLRCETEGILERWAEYRRDPE